MSIHTFLKPFSALLIIDVTYRGQPILAEAHRKEQGQTLQHEVGIELRALERQWIDKEKGVAAR